MPFPQVEELKQLMLHPQIIPEILNEIEKYLSEKMTKAAKSQLKSVTISSRSLRDYLGRAVKLRSQEVLPWYTEIFPHFQNTLNEKGYKAESSRKKKGPYDSTTYYLTISWEV